jgi:tetraacyldisaccharide 4'-kinase
VVLDDGAQYFRLHRDAEVLLVDALDDLDQQRLFPRGRLREPLSHLRRAHAIIVTHADLAPPGRLGATADAARSLAPGTPLVHSRHRATGLRRLGLDTAEPLETLRGVRVLAVSAVGRPEAFLGTLKSLGADAVGAAFGDHHVYDEGDVALLHAAAVRADCGHVVTTPKDAVRLAGLPGTDEFLVLGCELEVLDGQDQLRQVLAEAVGG